MERYQVIIRYDGTAFGGLQRQENTRTIQGDFETALRNIGWKGKSVLAAGRTDAGVHAAGQVLAFDLEWKHSNQDLCNALNANLPPDIGVQRVNKAKQDFHPRFDATVRKYRYQIICCPNRDPLRERYAWRVWPEPDLDLLRACAAGMVGEHDFSAFGTPPIPGGTTVRQVYQADWAKHDDQLVFDISANAYLYHMVRRMVHYQVEIGLGKIPLNDLGEVLLGQGSEMIQGLAPACGLFLQSVRYPD